MCKLNLYKDKTRWMIGYKAMVKKGDDYYSISTGMKYPNSKTERIVHPSHYNHLSRQIRPGDKPGHFAYSPNLVGRTAMFKRLSECKHTIEPETITLRATKEGYRFIYAKIRISDEIMEGEYNSFIVYAGRKMVVLEEIDV